MKSRAFLLAEAGRLRGTYEWTAEEVIFREIVQSLRRGADTDASHVALPDDLAVRFYEGMAGANTYSYDNPASDTVSVPTLDEFKAEIAALQQFIKDLKTQGKPRRLCGPR